MAIPILEGIQLLGAASGLIHELKGIPAALRGSGASKAPSMGSSDFQALLQQAYNAGKSSHAAPATTVKAPVLSGDTPATEFRAKLAAFKSEVGKVFNKQGLSSSEEIVLSLDENGQVRVMNDHPDKERIEAFFTAFPMLNNLFRALSLAASRYQMLDNAPEYMREFVQDPASATTNYGNVFSENAPFNFALTIGGGDIDWAFDGGSGDSASSGGSASA